MWLCAFFLWLAASSAFTESMYFVWSGGQGQEERKDKGEEKKQETQEGNT